MEMYCSLEIGRFSGILLRDKMRDGISLNGEFVAVGSNGYIKIIDNRLDFVFLMV